MHQKSILLAYIKKKNILPRIFLNLVRKKFFSPKGTFSIKLIGVYFKSQIKFWHRIGLVDDYC